MNVTVKEDTNLHVRAGQPSVNAPIVKTLAPGTIFEVDDDLYPGDSYEGVNTWLKDDAGNYYWSGGVVQSDVLNKMVGQINGGVFSDLWFDKLGILNIWNQFNERGENAKVLILDSGINTDIVQITSAIQNPTKNFVPGSNTIKNLDPDFHGTHCASLIAARGKTQFIGAAPGCKLYIGKITDNGSLDDAGTMKDALTEFLKDEYSFDVISISQELYAPDDDLEALIKSHIAKNRIIVTCIGNDYQYNNNAFLRYPGAYVECISVGSCTNDIALSKFSMAPLKTNIFCFGEKIMSYKSSDTPQPLTGTSQATAIVAGICCLIVSWLKKNSFVYNNSSVRELLQKYGTPLNNHPTYKLIQPKLIFDKLKTFANNENKNLQNCIDTDNGSAI